MSTERETYLGDGLYASFDGYQIRLRTSREGGDHEVYLDDPTLRAFLEFVEGLPKTG
jgi:hypothetical protein